MDSIEKLTAIFEKFPGIGPRQAGRFVQFLLRNSHGARAELARLIEGLGASVHQCAECMRHHSGKHGACSICENMERDNTLLAVVANDTDLLAMERSGTYRGLYFVLGGTISLASEKTNGLRIKQLLTRVVALKKRYEDFAEVVLAFPANPEGDATASLLRDELRAEAKKHGFKITSLGRGLSTGSELEYADPDTIKSALDSRR